ncbi:AAA family ATPase, partial [Hydrogenobaculum acidophilum]
KEAFSGNKELFKGLYLYDNWDWNKKYPIVKFDLSQAYPDTEEKLEYSLTSFLEDEAKKHSIVLEKKYLGLKFQEL